MITASVVGHKPMKEVERPSQLERVTCTRVGRAGHDWLTYRSKVTGLYEKSWLPNSSRLRQRSNLAAYKALAQTERHVQASNMGSLDPERDSFEAAKIRINAAFEYLKSEMKEIQRQDMMLLKELMYIRHIILLLSNHPDRRSYSISALDPSSIDGGHIRRPCLTRVSSAPLQTNDSEEVIPEEDQDDDVLAQSLNSADLPRFGCLSKPLPETDIIYALAPLPPVFRKLLQQSEVIGASDPESRTDSLLTQLQKTYTQVTCSNQYDAKLHDYVAKRKLFQRQKSIDEGE